MRAQDQIKRMMRGGGQDKRGRSRRGDRFVKLDHWFLKTAAWRATGPAARAVYVELAQRYNGVNNGEISMSVREAADLVHIAKDTASKAFHELEDKGFVKRHVCGSFNWKVQQATTWVLTEFALGEKAASKDFAGWTPPKSEIGPKSGSARPNSGTILSKLLHQIAILVPRLGPPAQSCTVSRSQIAARI